MNQALYAHMNNKRKMKKKWIKDLKKIPEFLKLLQENMRGNTLR
jgi:hypothetical protein